jgi:hypothetical protein
MKSSVLPIFISLVFSSFHSLTAEDYDKAQPVDIQALTKRFDAEAKPFFTVDKSTTFAKIDGGFTYLPEGSLVPVLDGIMKVNGFFCNKAMSKLVDSSKFVKTYESAFAELNALKKKIDDAKVKVDVLENDFTVLDKKLDDIKHNRTLVKGEDSRSAKMQLNIALGKKRNELSDEKRDLKKLEKDFDKKKEIPDTMKTKVDAVKTALNTFLENQKKLAAKTENKPVGKKAADTGIKVH